MAGHQHALSRTQTARSEFLHHASLDHLISDGYADAPLSGNALHCQVGTGVWSLHRPLDPNAAKKPVGYAAADNANPMTHERPDYVMLRNPFDLSNQHMTPPLKHTVPDPTEPSKPLIRVFDNKFPVLSPQRSGEKPGEVRVAFVEGLFPEINAIGTHEVVVQHHRYNICEALMSDTEVMTLWRTLQRRFIAVGEGSRYVQLLENHGMRSGGSLPHPHSQLLGLPFVPGSQMSRLQIALDFWHLNKACIFDAIVEKTSAQPEALQRTVVKGKHVLAFVPNAEERRNEM